MSVARIEVLEPVVRMSIPRRTTAPLLDGLSGRRVGYHHARGPYLQVAGFAERLGELLERRFGVREMVRLKSIVDNGAAGWSDPDLPRVTERVYDEYARRVDCVVVGAAFCGGSTYWSTHACCELQDRGVPTVLLVSNAFKDLSEYTCRSRGYDEIPFLVLPDDFESKRPDELARLAELHVDELVSRLARRGALATAAR
ncbi:MAG: hypothetical protein KGJ98_00150 [Chloroflexota bacterium]|nr:hypothetical protein [Chloroflexota bacterium]